MGKAIAVIAVSIALVLIVAIIAFVVRRNYRDTNTAPEMGDLGLKQERELRRLVDDAALTMRSIGVSYHINESDILSDRSRGSVNEWLRRYDEYHQKEINA